MARARAEVKADLCGWVIEPESGFEVCFELRSDSLAWKFKAIATKQTQIWSTARDWKQAYVIPGAPQT